MKIVTKHINLICRTASLYHSSTYTLFMPTIEVSKKAKEKIFAMRNPTPGKDRVCESAATVVDRLLGITKEEKV